MKIMPAVPWIEHGSLTFEVSTLTTRPLRLLCMTYFSLCLLYVSSQQASVTWRRIQNNTFRVESVDFDTKARTSLAYNETPTDSRLKPERELLPDTPPLKLTGPLINSDFVSQLSAARQNGSILDLDTILMEWKSNETDDYFEDGDDEDYKDANETTRAPANRTTIKPPTPIPPAVPRLRRVVCSVNASSMDRDGLAKFMIQNVNADYCTDIYYDHAEVRNDTYNLKSLSSLDVLPVDENLFLPRYTAINDLKIASRIRTFLTVTESESVKFTELAYDKKKGRAFVESCVRNLRLWGFDGLAVKWPYPPEAPELTRLLKRLRLGFNTEKVKTLYMRLQLGVILSGDADLAEELYEVQAINDLVDQITIMVYEPPDYSSGKTALATTLYWVSKFYMPVPDTNFTVDAVAPDFDKPDTSKMVDEKERLRPRRQAPSNPSGGSSADGNRRHIGHSLSVDAAVREFVRLGVDKSKVNIAVSLIGHSYKLKTASKNLPSAPIAGPGPASKFDGVKGNVYAYEMCNMTQRGTVMRASAEDATPYWYHGNLWISYEDKESIEQKTEYLKESSIGGIMLVSQSEDDFTGLYCNQGVLPLSRMVYDLSNQVMLYNIEGEREWYHFCGSASRTPVFSCWIVVFGVRMMQYVVSF